jgi:hypothetical protein
MQCSVNDTECVPGRLRRGMCERHYQRMRRRGSTGNPRIDNLHHFTVDESGCWLWDGAIWPNGYGKTSTLIHDTRLAHRVLYIEHRGPVPDGLDLDHLCRVRHCVNPAHLEPVSRSVNLTRGYVARGTCRNGLHDLTVEGSTRPGTRRCLACWRATYRAAGARYRQRQCL